jgi:hypothetical protein
MNPSLISPIRPSGDAALSQAGVKLSDFGSLHPYDDFLIAIAMQLEMLGFCKHGQSCDSVHERSFSYRSRNARFI